MGIISVSLPDGLAEQMDKLIAERGYSGRSDFIRAAVRDFIYPLVQEDNRTGARSATMTLVYPTSIEKKVSEVAHEYGSIITSLMHSHVGRERCVTVYIVEGDSGAIRRFTAEFKKLKDTELVSPIYTDAKD